MPYLSDSDFSTETSRTLNFQAYFHFLNRPVFVLLFVTMLMVFSCKKDSKEGPDPGNFQLVSIFAGSTELSFSDSSKNQTLAVDATFRFQFSTPLDTSKASAHIQLLDSSGTRVAGSYSFEASGADVLFKPVPSLGKGKSYVLAFGSALEAISGQRFPGYSLRFSTERSLLKVDSFLMDGVKPVAGQNLQAKRARPGFQVWFSVPIQEASLGNSTLRILSKSGIIVPSYQLSPDGRKLDVQLTNDLASLTRFTFSIGAGLVGKQGEPFAGLNQVFYSSLDSTDKFPRISDEALLTKVQEQTFRYFYDFAHPTSGLARERDNSGNLVTIGGSGFGIMALIVGMERNFITRQQGLNQCNKIVSFLKTADRFHGAWPHWMNGSTGKTIPFSTNDDGADLVETAFMVQGLLTLRQYLNPADPEENFLRNKVDTLWREVEWNWFQKNNENVLYWHWSPRVGWAMNHQLRGWNETLITYVLAASSPTYTISKPVYHNGFARNGGMANGQSYYGFTLPLGEPLGGPLFFAHYSFLGLKPTNLADVYANYWTQNVRHSQINHAYCKANPKRYIGYGQDCWGLTASDNFAGYNAHSPTNDLGVITPTAALSSFPYTPAESMAALKHFYYRLGDRTWGPYGFYDAFAPTQDWWGRSYLAIDQGPIIIMIENHRTGLLWNLFMSAPEVQQGLIKLGFQY